MNLITDQRITLFLPPAGGLDLFVDSGSLTASPCALFLLI